MGEGRAGGSYTSGVLLVNPAVVAMASYFRYWGKARPDVERAADESPCHLLPFHSLDVAAVGYRLFSPSTARCRSLAQSLDLEPEQLQSLVTFSLALHDLGKFARAFQSLAEPDLAGLVPADPRLVYRPHHSAAGAILLAEVFLGRQLSGDGVAAWGWKKSTPAARQYLRMMLGAAFGHHGEPVASDNYPDVWASGEDVNAAWQFCCDVAGWLKPQWPEDRVGDKAWQKKFRQLSWHLAGFFVLADWLGSDQSVFRYQSTPQPLEDYWREKALPGADEILTRLGFDRAPSPTVFPGFSAFFGFSPTPLQYWVESLSWREGAQLFVLEDVTGAGKTEASMMLTHRLLEHGQAQGVYFGLPTMATSNAMYQRVSGVYQRWFQPGRKPNLVLAHGASRLNADFNASLSEPQREDHGYAPEESTASAACNRWFADSRKKALLADVGVGTIDQALMAVLPFRHQSLRLIGLANKVLVVDEVHACDDYMARLLETVLEAHARQGGSAILLTATLPHAMRQSLVSAFLRGRGDEPTVLLPTQGFPLATHVAEGRVTETPLATRACVARQVGISLLHEDADVVAQLVAAARAGRCACWVRNTVDDAIDAYQKLRDSVDEPDKVMLFHSRFVMADRQAIEQAALTRFGKESTAEDRAGYILVSTQVVEQSLDLDFDDMVSDLAPIDLLIQRAGRLHRHQRDAKGNLSDTGKDGRESPILSIRAPQPDPAPASDWLSSNLPGTGAVYRDHGQLWLTLDVLQAEGGISMPGRARHLVESVFGEHAEAAIPEGLQKRHLDQEGERSSRRAMAGFNRLDMNKGYVPAASHGWTEDVDIGTRLTEEPSVTVTLVRYDEASDTLMPWVETGSMRWELSQLKVRESLARRLSDVPKEYGVAMERLLKERPQLKYGRLWVPGGEVEIMSYSSVLGLLKSRKSAE